MTFKKWAWDLFETTGNLEAFLAMKEAEEQEKIKAFGKMELGDIELEEIPTFEKNSFSNVKNETDEKKISD